MNTKLIIKIAGGIIVILYLFLFFASSTGYYQYKLNKKTALTAEAIEKFEQDIKDGKKVDITDYFDEEVNYDNSMTKINKQISAYVNKAFESAFDYLFKYLNSQNK